VSRPDGDGRITPTFTPAQVEKAAPCQHGCPNSGDIRSWIGAIAQHKRTGISREQAFSNAWEILADVNPFPAVLGRVCPHPCEAHCNRGDLDEPLAINAMERFLGDWGIQNDLPLPRLSEEMHPEWLGVIGAGPSGLSFAYQMARRGYRVTVYERQDQPGGMLRYGIPDYRLPQDVLDAEIARILDLGVELRLGCAVGRDITLKELHGRHQALYLGIGAQRGRGLGIPGEGGAGVLTGTEYLDRVNRGESVDLGGSVAVIGGGNTAIDAARTARRTGATVSILYRRSREEMPAFDPEIDEALEEGVSIHFLTAPVRLVRENGALRSITAQMMSLGEPDDSGRRRPVPVPDSEFRIEVDSVLAAVSQEPDWKGLGAGLDLDGGWVLTDEKGAVGDRMWAGGDVRGPGIAGEAIVHGRKAAESIHQHLRGVATPETDGQAKLSSDRIVFEYFGESPAAMPQHIPAAERLEQPGAEVTQAITEEQMIAEANRCFSCGVCSGCQQCWMFCTAGCFTKVETVEPGMYFTLSLDACESCGKCIEVCPCGFLEAR
jgi:NADPH-dependent glutamate synthase beta subunit-like oxidoreductase